MRAVSPDRSPSDDVATAVFCAMPQNGEEKGPQVWASKVATTEYVCFCPGVIVPGTHETELESCAHPGALSRRAPVGSVSVIATPSRV